MRNRISLSIVLLVAGSQLACSSSATTAVEPAVPQAAPEQEEVGIASIPEKSEKLSNVSISERIRQACGIAESDTFFAYNSSKVSPAAERLLQKLADCFSTGPLKDERMNLVGHTDPRGEDEFNLSLGGRRAENVKSKIVTLGLGEDHVVTVSRGELEARGEDESGWARDRKVEVKIVE